LKRRNCEKERGERKERKGGEGREGEEREGKEREDGGKGEERGDSIAIPILRGCTRGVLWIRGEAELLNL